ncbi:MAG: carboxypeptidase-like regulatory domain-containing protein [Acidimicrobiales bacterium]
MLSASLVAGCASEARSRSATTTPVTTPSSTTVAADSARPTTVPSDAGTPPDRTSTPRPTAAPRPPSLATPISGRVWAGPTCPVELVDNPCPARALTDVTVQAVTADGRVYDEVTTDADGHYELRLVPGTYSLRATHESPFPRCPDTRVSVVAGSPQSIDISCDTGIR